MKPAPRTLSGLVLALIAAFFCLSELDLRYRQFTRGVEREPVETYLQKFAQVRQDLPKTSRLRYESSLHRPSIERELRSTIELFRPHMETAVELVRTDSPVLPLVHHQLVRQLVDFFAVLPPERRRGLTVDEAIALIARYFAGVMNLSAVRYALAPHTVTQSEDADYVVGDYGTGPREDVPGFEVIREYDNGIVLLRR